MQCIACGHQSPPGSTSSTCSRCGAPVVAENDVTFFGPPTGGETMLPGPREATKVGDGTDATSFRPPRDGDPRLERQRYGMVTVGVTTPPPTGVPGGGVAPAPAGGDTGPLALGASFGSRYHIIRLLGIGGMGAVYQAWDAELGVAVAIKVIRPEISEDPTAAAEVERRFKRELLLARQVTHPNVVRIHDLGEIDGIKYITMSYVEGSDLSTLLKQEGRLPIGRTLAIARQVASGLVAAHKADVVHRDLKPANIMVDVSGQALIMDFGIARSTGGAALSMAMPGNAMPAARQTLSAKYSAMTMDGAVVGTIEYMAPEQAKGQPVDQRADVYTFGLIVYDMLTGRRRAAHSPSAIAELQGRMNQAPPRITSLAPDVPEAVDQIVSRCIEPDPAKRYQTSADLAADLERLDEAGEPIPEPRRLTPRMIAAAAVLVAALVTGTWWLTRSRPVPEAHDPVTVVIADFENNTGDPAFDHTLEPMVRRALESASFISAYDRSRIRATFSVRPPEKLDEVAAREIALKQGVGVVLSGSIDRRGNSYDISVKAAQTVTGKVIAGTKTRVGKDQVLGAATKLVTTVRKALGDETSDSAQLLAMKSLSTTSIEVAGHYAAAIEAQSNSKFEEARGSFLKAVEKDPNFGLGYQGLAVMSRNLGKLQDADKYSAEALRHLEGMTERERFAVRASYYMTTGDSQQCVKEYGELIAQFAADAVAHNNRALCLTKLRSMREAVDEMRQAVKILPKRVAFLGNLAMYAAYAGDFETAKEEAGKLPEPTDLATLALAFAQLGQGDLPAATATYQKLGAISARGASWAASGTGDLALHQGHFSAAVRLFEQGAAADLTSKNADKAARKLTSLAYAHLLQGRKGPAIAAAEQALLHSNAAHARFLAARIFVEADAVARAQTVAARLSAELPAEPQAYGKIIDGEIAMKNGDARQAIKILTDASGLLDTWLGHFDLGRAYLELEAFPQADSEFDRCIKRRGEALSLFVDEEPTYGYFPAVYYYQGLAREGLKNPASADSYREYLKIRGTSSDDPLLPEIRRRAGR